MHWTGHTSTHALSFTSIHASVMMARPATALSLCVGYDRPQVLGGRSRHRTVARAAAKGQRPVDCGTDPAHDPRGRTLGCRLARRHAPFLVARVGRIPTTAAKEPTCAS